METQGDPVQSKDVAAWAPVKRFTRPMGWFLAGIGLLNLFDNLDIIKLESQFWGWIATYRHVVESIGDVLLGWVNNITLPDWPVVRHFSFAYSPFDAHVFTLLLLATLPLLKSTEAKVYDELDDDDPWNIDPWNSDYESHNEGLDEIGCAAIFGYPFALYMLLMSESGFDDYSSAGIILFIALCAIWYYIYEGFVDGRKYLVNVVAACLMAGAVVLTDRILVQVV